MAVALMQDIESGFAPLAPFAEGHGRPRLLPRRIVTLSAGGQIKHYRWRMTRLGAVDVTEQSEFTPFKKGQGCIVVIDPSLLFRRRSQFAPKTRSDLLRLGADFFPFAADQTRYASRKDDGAHILYALTEQEWLNLQKSIPAPAVAIIPGETHSIGIAKAIEERLATGVVCDLLIQPGRFLSPAYIVAASLIAVLAVMLIAGWSLWQWQQAYRLEKLQQEVSALEAEVAPIQKRFEAIEIMQATLQQMGQMSESEGSAMIAAIGKLVSSMPQGISIDRVDYKDGKLNFSGLGKNAERWLQEAGVSPNDIQITPMPQWDRYVATLPVGMMKQ